MFKYPFYLVQYLLWIVGNLRRRLVKPPDFIVFTLEGAYPELPTQRAGFLRRRLFPGPRLSLQELGDQFRALQQDSRIKGVVLHLRSLEMPPAPSSDRARIYSSIAFLWEAGCRMVNRLRQRQVLRCLGGR